MFTNGLFNLLLSVTVASVVVVATLVEVCVVSTFKNTNEL